jgi:phosphoribosylamine--glycine ligase
MSSGCSGGGEMNVLLLGSGGREHALALALSKSSLLSRLFAAPGNPGIARLATLVPLSGEDHAAVVAFCKDQEIDLVVIGPEAPLVSGLVDSLAAQGIKAFGPSASAAQLEGSKAFAKEICAKFSIPTAASARFSDASSAKDYLRAKGAPIVVKADGLAAGKGVIVAETLAEAEAAIDAMFSGQFGEAGKTVLLEEKLIGEEVSFFALSDGRHAVALGSAQDHKRLGEGDTGPNTGGMGAFSPVPCMDRTMSARVMDEIVRPLVAGMEKIGTPFAGLLFVGLMMTADGPKVIEFNVRFGDPETQAILPRLTQDLLPLLKACADGTLSETAIGLSQDCAVTIVLAAKGYPDTPKKGGEIRGLQRIEAMPDVIVTHAGTKRDGEKLIANSGRVLNVTGLDATLDEARARAYAAIAMIDWPDAYWRRDIGKKAGK